MEWEFHKSRTVYNVKLWIAFQKGLLFPALGYTGEKITKTGNGARWGEGGGRRSRGSRPTLAAW